MTLSHRCYFDWPSTAAIASWLRAAEFRWGSSLPWGVAVA